MDHFDDLTQLIGALFGETRQTEDGVWSAFLSRLSQVTQSVGADLILDLRGQRRRWSNGLVRDYDLSMRQAMRFDRVYSQENLPFTNAQVAPTRIVKVRVSQAATVTLGIQRAEHDRDFRSADGQVLHGLVPFLGQAMALWLEHLQERSETEIGARMLADLGGAWVLFDLTGRVLRVSEAAQLWSKSLGMQMTEGAAPKFADAGLWSEFNQALAKMLAGDAAALSLGQGELALAKTEFDKTPAILGQIRKFPTAKEISPQSVAQHFGLSISEARLAILICDGHSIKDAAQTLGWTEETTRTCSKAIFARLDVNGQPNLVRRILNSAVWFTPVR